MLKRVLISAVALASACDAFSFVPANPLTAAGVARRANVLPQPRSAQAPALGLSLRSLKAVASSNPQTFAFPPVLGLGFKALGKRLVRHFFREKLAWVRKKVQEHKSDQLTYLMFFFVMPGPHTAMKVRAL